MKHDLAILSLFLGLTGMFVVPASADEGDDRAKWFDSLLQPGTRAPCCDISDCQRTVADWRDGQWWALVVGEWTPIPPGAVLNNTPSIDGDAYVCATHYREIYCFIKPNFGM